MAEARQKAGRLQELGCLWGPATVVGWEPLHRPESGGIIRNFGRVRKSSLQQVLGRNTGKEW